jgi:hypothetical protein
VMVMVIKPHRAITEASRYHARACLSNKGAMETTKN